MIVALLCRTCKNVFDYKLKDFWEKTSCPCCGSKETSIRQIPEDRHDLIQKFYKEK